jgi:Myb-like DNA-binding protein
MNKYHYSTWTAAEDKLLTEIMQTGMKERVRILVLFNRAEKRLGRTAKSCQNRWYEIRAREAV